MLRRVFADVLFVRGGAQLRSGRVRQALSSFAWAVRLGPSTIQFLSAAALAAQQAGERDRAVEYGERALELDADLRDMYAMLSGLFLHGEGYQQVLARI